MPQQRCFSVLLGARNTPSAGRRFLARDETLIRQVTARHFPDGFTILRSSGGWYDPDEKAFRAEESRQILVMTARRAALRGWCDALACALRQKEILVVELGRASTFTFARAASGRAAPRRRSRSR